MVVTMLTPTERVRLAIELLTLWLHRSSADDDDVATYIGMRLTAAAYRSPATLTAQAAAGTDPLTCAAQSG